VIDHGTIMQEIKDATKELRRAKKAMERASAARMALPPGSSRARVTTANARLNTYCEAVDRWEKKIATLMTEHNTNQGAFSCGIVR
jgi:hypothetical protein